MWPLLLDITEDESKQGLRHLELEAYASLVSAFRAQGSLTQNKRRILEETSTLLNISNQRHKIEVRRATSDERLNTIAYHITGHLTSFEEWAQEGRRSTPLLPRVPPQTTYSAVADEASNAASQQNKLLPFPVNTERKRPVPQSVSPAAVTTESSRKSPSFRVPDVPKDEPKRRKCHSVGETSSLAQHLLAPKLSKIQQIYRQATKMAKQKVKEQMFDAESADANKMRPNGAVPQLAPVSIPKPKINIIQNVTIPPRKQDMSATEENSTKDSIIPINRTALNENQAPSSIKCSTLDIKDTQTVNSDDILEPAKFNATSKKTISIGQKVIVVSNAQTIPSNSILQKTLSVPMNKLTKLNIDKFKILPNAQLPSPLQAPKSIVNQNTPLSKPKLVTIKGTSTKKVIPLSQLQMLNPKKTSLKVIPYSGKINDKSVTPTNTPIKKTPVVAKTPVLPDTNVVAPLLPDNTVYNLDDTKIQSEKNKSEFNGIFRNGERSNDGFDMKLGEFRLPDLNYEDMELGSSETLSSESSEAEDMNGNGDSYVESMEETNCEFLQSGNAGEVLHEYEVIHTNEIL